MDELYAEMEMEDKETFHRSLYPHNSNSLAYIQSCLNSGINAAISAPKDTGTKFAVIEFAGNNWDKQILCVTGTKYGREQIETQMQKTGCGYTDNIVFSTYKSLSAEKIQDLKIIARGINIVIFMDYLNHPETAAESSKIEKFIKYLPDDVMRIGFTNIRPFFLTASADLRERHSLFLGEGVQLIEFFDLRTACMYGNFTPPIYTYTDLSQNSRIQKFCKEVSGLKDKDSYKQFMTHAHYYAAPKEKATLFLKEHVWPELIEGKYVVLCKNQASIEKNCIELQELLEDAGVDISVYLDLPNGDEDGMVPFLELEEETCEEVSLLFTTINRTLDVKISDAIGTFLMYAPSTPWEVYQAVNAGLAFARSIHGEAPLIVDLYNSVYKTAYCGNATLFGATLKNKNCLAYELGRTPQELYFYEGLRKPKTTEYVEIGMPETQNLNQLIWDYTARRLQDDDPTFLQSVIDQNKEKHWNVSMSYPYAFNGINLFDWCKKKTKHFTFVGAPNLKNDDPERFEAIKQDIINIAKAM